MKPDRNVGNGSSTLAKAESTQQVLHEEAIKSSARRNRSDMTVD
jgi:hypothetical protein